MEDTIEFGWKTHERSDLEDVRDLKVTATIEIETEEARRILEGFAMGFYQDMTSEEIREKLKERASKVEVEKIHYNSSL